MEYGTEVDQTPEANFRWRRMGNPCPSIPASFRSLLRRATDLRRHRLGSGSRTRKTQRL